MCRRVRRLVLVVAGLAALVTAGMFVLWPREDRITQENCDRIREGMTPAEVEAILGPPGDYRTCPTDPELPDPFPGFHGGQVPAWPIAWQGDHGVIYVCRNGHDDPAIAADEPDAVNIAEFIEVRRIDQGPFANLLWRAKRQWRRWFSEE